MKRKTAPYCLSTGCDWNDRQRHCMDAERAATCPRKFTRNPKPTPTRAKKESPCPPAQPAV